MTPEEIAQMNAATGTAVEPAVQAPAALPPEFQRRLDEMTVMFNQTQQALANQQAINAELMGQVAQVRAPAQQPAVPTPLTLQVPEGMDPATANFFGQLTKGFQEALDQSNKRTEQLVHQVNQNVQAQTSNLALNQALNGQPPAVADMASKLFNQWAKEGKTGWLPRDAVDFARYNLGLPKAFTPAVPPRGNANETIVQAGAAAPNVQAPTQQQGEAIPDEVVKTWPLVKQIQYYEKRIGGGDSAIVYQ